MKIETKQVGDVTVLHVGGELGLYDAPELRDLFKDLLNQGQLRIIFNCKELGYMDSSGLGAVIAGQKSIISAGGAFIICETPQNIYSLLHTVGLESIFTLTETEEEALEKLQ